MDVNVCILIFNRPRLTEQVFRRIADARPRRLLIVADGPRREHPEDAPKCAAARAAVEQVDWPCEVLRDYADENLGCGRRVSSGLDWVFRQVDEAIILEDDCLPHPCFFSYCGDLLQRYRGDQRIMQISGDNFQQGRRRTEHSYYFSKYQHVWGWATWRRAWQHYDFAMTSWPEFWRSGLLRLVCEEPYEQRFWSNQFRRVRAGAVDTWDFQWLYACWSQGGLAALPAVNLVTNIGTGAEAVHTKRHHPGSNLPTADLGPLSHPPFVVAHREADRFTLIHHFGGCWRRRIKARLQALAERVLVRSRGTNTLSGGRE